MKELQIKQALNQLVDQAIPANYDPVQAVQKRIQCVRQVGERDKNRVKVQPSLRIAGWAILLLLVGLALFLTPPGQSVAQGVLRFFTLAQSDQMPLPNGRPTEPPVPSRTTAPTRLAELVTASPPGRAQAVEVYPTRTPAPRPTSSLPIWNLSLEEAEALAGFDLRVPADLPPGYRLDNVIFDPKTREVAQIYSFHPYSAGEQFFLHQRLSLNEELIGPSAGVNQFFIGDILVEYVTGSWLDDSSGETETWHSDSIFHTFRWQEGKTFFALEILFDESDTWSPAYWTQDSMQAMLELAIGARSEFPEQINLNYLTSLEQAEAVAGFSLLAPTRLPENFIFSRAVYEPEAKKVVLFYQPDDGSRASSGVRLLITEKQVDDQPTLDWSGMPQEAVEDLSVNGAPAVFIRGAIVDGVYSSEARLSLVWRVDGLEIEMVYYAPAQYPTRLDRDRLVIIGESMQ